jgi:hypothetical protein
MCAKQPGLVILQQHVGLGELQPARAQRLDLPALQHDPGLEALLDEIVVPRPAVDCNAVGGIFLLVRHEAFYRQRAVVRAAAGGDNRRMRPPVHA